MGKEVLTSVIISSMATSYTNTVLLSCERKGAQSQSISFEIQVMLGFITELSKPLRALQKRDETNGYATSQDIYNPVTHTCESSLSTARKCVY